MVKAVIFDLDDTLISEMEYIKSGYRHISKILSKQYSKNEDEIYQLLIALFNRNPGNVFNRFFEKMKLPYNENEIKLLVEDYRGHRPSIEFYSDVLPCLEELKKNGIKIGIITDGYYNAQRQKLKAVKAYEYFEEIIITDEIGRDFWKPHPKPFELMKDKLNLPFNEMFYVGDNPEKDFYISSIYPIRTVRINRNGVHSKRSYLSNIREHYVVQDLFELQDLVKGI